MNIGIVIVATNAYFVLGLRFLKKFRHYYQGSSNISFFFFSNEDPTPYLNLSDNTYYYLETHKTWRDGTNSKFKNILRIESELKEKTDYVYYFDADTDIKKPFTENWFIGDLVGGEHFGNRTYRKNGTGLDRNKKSQAYVPLDTTLPYTYYYGAFFGGKVNNVIEFCRTLRNYQTEDEKIQYEPKGHDESYINKYFHFNPPTHIVLTENFMFNVSHKGGLGYMRNPNLNVEAHKEVLRANKGKPFELLNNTIRFI